MDSIVEREIAELKRGMLCQGRWLQVSFASWVVAGSFFLYSAAGVTFFDNVRVKRLSVVDSKGVERLILTADSEFAVINHKPHKRASKVSGVILQNANGDEMGGMGTQENGAAAIAIDGYADTPVGMWDRVGLISLPNGTAGFVLNDYQGQSRAQILSGKNLDVDFSLLPGKYAEDATKARVLGRVRHNGEAEWTVEGIK